MRLFIALDIDDAIRSQLQRFMEGVRGFAANARWVRPESLHVTLKFIGEKSPEGVEEIRRALAEIQDTSMEITFRGYGFFPTPRAARVFWVGIQAGPGLAKLASDVDAALSKLGIPKEEHAFSPHLTLARGGKSGSPRRQKGDVPNATFQHLQDKLAALPQPEFGTMAAREFFLYESKLSRGGSIYSKMHRFPLA
jgi:RNA 2',3'-cyclic 3'-phosphodiesterase